MCQYGTGKIMKILKYGCSAKLYNTKLNLGFSKHGLYQKIAFKRFKRCHLIWILNLGLVFVFHLWNDFICTQCKAQSMFGLKYCLKSKSFLFRYLLHPFMVHKLFLKVMSLLYQPIGVRIWRMPRRNNYKTIYSQGRVWLCQHRTGV